MESQKYKKLVTKTKKKQTHKEQTRGYQQGVGVGGRAIWGYMKSYRRVYEIMCVKLLKSIKNYKSINLSFNFF